MPLLTQLTILGVTKEALFPTGSGTITTSGSVLTVNNAPPPAVFPATGGTFTILTAGGILTTVTYATTLNATFTGCTVASGSIAYTPQSAVLMQGQTPSAAAFTYLPVTKFDPDDGFNYVIDNSFAGAPSRVRGAYQAEQDATAAIDGWMYPEALGILLPAIGFADTITGAGPTYNHAFKVPTGFGQQAQGPSWLLAESDLFEYRGWNGMIADEVTITADAKGSTKYTAKMKGWKSASLGSTAVATPGVVTVTPTGATGAVAYAYRISALNAFGETLAGAEGTTATGNASLTVVNYNALSWAAVPGAVSYNVYGRTTGAELKLTNTAGTTYNDTGVLTPTGALPGANTTLPATGTYAASPPFLGWEVTVQLGGIASTRFVMFEALLKRTAQGIHTFNGVQQPRSVFQGAVEVHLKTTALFEDQVELNNYILNNQNQFSLTMTQPGGGTNPVFTIVTNKGAWVKGARQRGKEYLEVALEVEGIANATDSGPLQFTLVNATSTAY